MGDGSFATERESKDLCICLLQQIRKAMSRQVLPRGIHGHDQLHLVDSPPALRPFKNENPRLLAEGSPIRSSPTYFGAGELVEEVLVLPAVLLFLWCFLCVAFLVPFLVVVPVSLEPVVEDPAPLCELPDGAV